MKHMRKNFFSRFARYMPSHWLSLSSPSRESGQSLVELSMGVLLLLLIIVGVVEIGMIGFHYISMYDAAQEGAAYASIYPNSCAEIENRVRSNLNDIDNSRILVSIQIGGQPCQPCSQRRPVAGESVLITVTDPAYPITMPLLSTFLGRSTLQMRARIEETVIRPECE